MEAIMRDAKWTLKDGLYVDLVGDWRVHVVEADLQRTGVMYVGGYPYDGDGAPLHPDAPAIAEVWDSHTPGARQISDRQKRLAGFTPMTHFEPTLGRLYA
jgi:hypothetical protein